MRENSPFQRFGFFLLLATVVLLTAWSGYGRALSRRPFGGCCQKTSAVRCWNTPLEKTSISDGLGSKTVLKIKTVCIIKRNLRGPDTP